MYDLESKGRNKRSVRVCCRKMFPTSAPQLSDPVHVDMGTGDQLCFQPLVFCFLLKL